RVWVLVDLPEGKHAIGTKWILKNKRDARGIVCRNKARLVAQGHRQEEGIDYNDVFASVAMAPRAWYATLSSFLLKYGYRRRTIEQTLFLKKDSKDIILVQIYVDDIIFGATRQDWSDEFEAFMQSQFEMSSMGQLTFFLAPTPFEPLKIKDKNLPDGPVNVHLYRSMIWSLMYLTASRLDITFAVSACARNQMSPTVSNLNVVKRIFKYIKGHPKLGLWYPRDSPFDLEAFSDSDYAGAAGDRKSTTDGCQFMDRRLISWQFKKKTIMATSSCKAKYVAAASCCGQYGFIPSDTMTRVTRNSFLLIVSQFWTTVSTRNLPNDQVELVATIDGHEHTISEATIRTSLHLNDLDAADVLPNQEIFDGLQAIGYRLDGPWSFLFKKGKFAPQ
nr:hypothetical protein [Tanacetum cinerariifolium]